MNSPCSKKFGFGLICLGSLLLSLQSRAAQLDTWTSQTSGTPNDFFAVAYGNAAFVATGTNGLLCSSTDGVSWTLRTSGTTNNLNGVTYGNGQFVAVGRNGSVRTSTNGTTWVGYLSGFSNAWHAVTYGNGLYVAVGFGGTIKISTTATNWTLASSPTTNSLQAVIWANGKYVASGALGTILTSPDGTNWTSQVSGGSNALRTLAYGAGTFVVAGSAGDLRTSPDGVTWTSRTSGTTNSLRGAIYTNGNFVVTGFRGTIISSANGTDWTRRSSGVTDALRGITYGADAFVTVGHNGRILLAPSLAVLTVNIHGAGSVMPNLNGSNLFVGRSYTMTAVPAINNLFSNWVSIVNGTTNVASSSASYTFLMPPHLTLEANFVTNRFIAAAGTYYGLFYQSNGATHDSAGFFTMKTTVKQTYSGTMLLDGNKLVFNGKFDVGGQSTSTILRTKYGKSDVFVRLLLDLAGGDQFTGSVSNAAWSSPLAGDRYVWNTNNPASAYSNKYTMILPGSNDASVSPGGDGYGLLSVSALGKVTLAGTLGDGRRISQLVPISKNGQWPLYVPLYPARNTATNPVTMLAVTNTEFNGSLLGWVTYGGNHHAPTGTVSWIKTSWTNGFYDSGFTNEIEILGSRYVPPPLGTRALNIVTASVAVANGNLSASFTNRFFWSTDNSASFLSPNMNAQELTVTTASGLLGGQFNHPDNSNKVTMLKGAVLQDQNVGRGLFLGTNQSGSFRLQDGVER